MVSQTVFQGISLFTLRAGEGLLPRVDYTVLVKGTGPGEGLVAGGAGEGLFSCVCPLVALQGSRLGKSLVTLGAEVRFISIMNSHVSTQML